LVLRISKPLGVMSVTNRCNASEIRSPVAASRLISAAYVLGSNESGEQSLVAARTSPLISSRE